jgi:hypothetical protein
MGPGVLPLAKSARGYPLLELAAMANYLFVNGAIRQAAIELVKTFLRFDIDFSLT